MTEKVLLSIGGHRSEALDGRMFERRNPVTGEVAALAAASGIADPVAAVETPAAALPRYTACLHY